MVASIKAKAKTWVPLEVHENPLSNLSVDDIKGLLGTRNEKAPDGMFAAPEELEAVPAAFDSRT